MKTLITHLLIVSFASLLALSAAPSCVVVPPPAGDVNVDGDDGVDDDGSVDDGSDGGVDGGDDGAIDESSFAAFVDPDTGFTTTDVHDVDEEIVRFDTSSRSIVWAADGRFFQTGLWIVNGNLLAGGGFQVRFGTSRGVRRAYFTETAPATICQIQVFGDALSISATNVLVPQE